MAPPSSPVPPPSGDRPCLWQLRAPGHTVCNAAQTRRPPCTSLCSCLESQSGKSQHPVQALAYRCWPPGSETVWGSPAGAGASPRQVLQLAGLHLEVSGPRGKGTEPGQGGRAVFLSVPSFAFCPSWLVAHRCSIPKAPKSPVRRGCLEGKGRQSPCPWCSEEL